MDFGRKSKDIKMETESWTEDLDDKEEEADLDDSVRQCPFKKFKADTDAFDGSEGNATLGTILGGDSEGNPPSAAADFDVADENGKAYSENGEETCGEWRF